VNQLALTFTQTRARRGDCDTSKAAAKHAASAKCAAERVAITKAVNAASDGLTAYEVADLLAMPGLDRFEASRRISECGLTKTDRRRDGCAVWAANA